MYVTYLLEKVLYMPFHVHILLISYIMQLIIVIYAVLHFSMLICSIFKFDLEIASITKQSDTPFVNSR